MYQVHWTRCFFQYVMYHNSLLFVRSKDTMLNKYVSGMYVSFSNAGPPPHPKIMDFSVYLHTEQV